MTRDNSLNGRFSWLSNDRWNEPTTINHTDRSSSHTNRSHPNSVLVTEGFQAFFAINTSFFCFAIICKKKQKTFYCTYTDLNKFLRGRITIWELVAENLIWHFVLSLFFNWIKQYYLIMFKICKSKLHFTIFIIFMVYDFWRHFD